jgi:hypothetical protein
MSSGWEPQQLLLSNFAFAIDTYLIYTVYKQPELPERAYRITHRAYGSIEEATKPSSSSSATTSTKFIVAKPQSPNLKNGSDSGTA